MGIGQRLIGRRCGLSRRRITGTMSMGTGSRNGTLSLSTRLCPGRTGRDCRYMMICRTISLDVMSFDLFVYAHSPSQAEHGGTKIVVATKYPLVFLQTTKSLPDSFQGLLIHTTPQVQQPRYQPHFSRIVMAVSSWFLVVSSIMFPPASSNPHLPSLWLSAMP